MTKCEICGEAIGEVFLKKITGTIVKDAKGKRHFVCNQCQKKHMSKEEVLTALK